MEYVDDRGNWRWDNFHGLFPSSVIMQIAGIAPPREQAGADRMIWVASHDGDFSTRTAYRALAPQPRDPDRVLWKLIWRTQVPQRVRSFLWLTAHDRLLTNKERFRRHLSASAEYEACGASESTLHVLRDCPCAKQMWHRLLPPCTAHAFFQQALRTWLRSNLSGSPRGPDKHWSSRFAFGIWCSWKWRNERTFENRLMGSEPGALEILRRTDSYVKAAVAYSRAEYEACGASESMLHVLRDCPCAKQMWHRLLPPCTAHAFLQQALRTWLQRNLSGSPRGPDKHWSSRFAFGILCSWKWRNERTFENRLMGSEAGALEILRRMDSYVKTVVAYSRAVSRKLMW
ncbi:Polynucleotidyl transferase- ribonuclease H-like superfamily protein [Striga hermonthica]|uniref:Polynucleotidyl transferase- ribonuclease H-like superfamily protein n=1 Tax=Striga hermonthica TaxID=68872 RepID=A0A9N7NGZ9_STRHE|nr:Polynucleotidyl transferase- ribonuclease H-like superfamily protein [Striga hermonthica]